MIKAEPVLLGREQLYEMIWHEPTRKVAARLGISDVGLAKICRKLHIPRPWRGYWREKETGNRPRQPKLPPWPAHLGKAPDAITFHAAAPPGEPPRARPAEPETVQQQRIYEAAAEHAIIVANTMADPDRLVRRAGRLLKRPGDRDLLRSSEQPCLDIQVTKDSLDRSLRIFDAILKAARARGWSTATQPEHPFQTQVSVLGESIAIQIIEKVRQVERPQPPKKDVGYLFRHERYTYESTGLLTLRLTDNPSFTWHARTWSDGKRQRLESCLHAIMIGFVELAEGRKDARRQQEQRRLEWAEQEGQRLAAVERQEREKDRREELKRQVDVWLRAREVRTYVAALRHAARDVLAREADGRLARWIRWAEQYVETRDPLRGVQALPLDPEGYGRVSLELDSAVSIAPPPEIGGVGE